MRPRHATLALLLAACGGAPTADDTAEPGTPIDDTGGTALVDADGDGFDVDQDCDDGDSAVNPGASESCNAIDDDCDGATDEDPIDGTTFYADADGDGFGDEGAPTVACTQPSGAVAQAGDCEDSSAHTFPGSTLEVCDGLDNDCDATTAGETGVWHEADGVWTELTASFAEGVADFATLVTVDPGTVHVCGGPWYVNLTASGATRVVGHGTGEAPLLGGTGRGAIISVEGAGIDLSVEDLRLANGGAQVGQRGGTISCSAEGEGWVRLDHVQVELSRADEGGVFWGTDCNLELIGSTLRESQAISGGALWILAATSPVSVRIEDSVITGNTATGWGSGGGVFVYGSGAPVTVSIVDSVISDNEAHYGGGLFASGEVATSCEATAGAEAGFRGNVSTRGDGGVTLYNEGGTPTFGATACDFGADGTTEDNAPFDLYVLHEDNGYDFGDAATFSCDGTSCD